MSEHTNATNNTTPVSNDNETIVKKGRKKRFLSNAFNIVAGFAVAATVKTAVTAGMTWACAPVASGLVLSAAALGVSALAVGGAVGTYAWGIEKYRAKKAGLTDTPKFWSKENKARMKRSALWSLVGGAAFLGLDAYLGQMCGTVTEVTETTETPAVQPAPVVQAPVNVEPVTTTVVEQTVVAPVETVDSFENPLADVTPCVTPMDEVAQTIEAQSTTVSDVVRSAFERAQSTNDVVAAQGTKDLAYALFNGDGIAKNADLALSIFCDAAGQGNVQAQVDVLYIQFHGLHGVEANPQAAYEAMQSINDDRATWFVSEWAKSGLVDAKASAISVKESLAGLKPTAPCAMAS